MIFKLAIFGILLFVGAMLWQRWGRARRQRFIEAYPYHQQLDQRLASRRPELSPVQRMAVLEGLRDYFLICLQAGRQMVAMPSQAVDDAWHEFILSTRAYDRFCRAAFGRFLHHTPAEAMTSPTQAGEGIRRAWRLACAQEGIDTQKPDRLPRLFALDAALGLVGGFVYALDCLAGERRPDGAGYCASHIGCASGCAGDSGDAGGDGGGGCGGD